MKKNNKSLIEINVPTDPFIDPIEVKDVKEVETKVNEARKSFASVHQKTMSQNKIVGIIFMGVMLGTIVLGMFLASAMLYVLIGLIVLFLGVFIYTKVSRNALKKEVGNYIDVYALECDSYLYKHEKLKEIKLGFKEHPDEEEIRKLEFVNDLFQVGTRDVIKGKMNDLPFEVSEVSLKVGNPKDKKTHKTVFVGKVFDFKCNIKDKGRVLLYMKGCGDATPNKLDDVNRINIGGLKKDWEVYSSNDYLKKIFTEPVIKALNEFKVDNVLNDIVISFNKNSILVGLSFYDDYMIIPLDQDFDSNKGLEHYKKDINTVIRLHEALISNPYLG